MSGKPTHFYYHTHNNLFVKGCGRSHLHQKRDRDKRRPLVLSNPPGRFKGQFSHHSLSFSLLHFKAKKRRQRKKTVSQSKGRCCGVELTTNRRQKENTHSPPYPSQRIFIIILSSFLVFKLTRIFLLYTNSPKPPTFFSGPAFDLS